MGLSRAVLFAVATSEQFERAIKLLPTGEAFAWRAASRYVAGRSRADALATAERLLAQGHAVSIDLFGERVHEPSVADRVLAGYLELVPVLPGPPADVWLSLDLSHLALAVDPAAAADRLADIAGALPAGGRVQVGAEEAAQTDAILGCVLEVAARGLSGGSAPRCRRTSCALAVTWRCWPTSASTSGS
jgi:proline dehydrogenase